LGFRKTEIFSIRTNFSLDTYSENQNQFTRWAVPRPFAQQRKRDCVRATGRHHPEPGGGPLAGYAAVPEEMLRCLIGASEAFDRAEKLTQSIGMKL